MSGPAAIVLAAGRSTRYRDAGGPAPTKLVALWRGRPVVWHVAEAALGSSAHPVVVVTGHAAEAVERALAGLPVHIVHNPGFADGLATSLRAGLQALPPGSGEAVILLGDMPLVDAAAIDTLIRAAREDPEADAAVPVHDGIRGNPVLLRRGLFARAASLRGDEGARRLLRDPALRVIELASLNGAVGFDVDKPDDLAAGLPPAFR